MFGWQIIKGCENPDCVCEDIETEFSPCYPLIAQSAPSIQSARTSADSFVVSFPECHAPDQWHNVRKAASPHWTVLRAPAYGWMFTFMRNQSGTSQRRDDQSGRPSKSQQSKDIETTITMVLPESKGPKEYRVAVRESECCATLETPGWNVTILKMPYAADVTQDINDPRAPKHRP
jgi:hypothetical protein